MEHKNQFPKLGIRLLAGSCKTSDLDAQKSILKDLANRTCQMLSDNIRYPNGEPLEIRSADTIIETVDQAHACSQSLKSSGTMLTLTIVRGTCDPAALIIPDADMIQAVWQTDSLAPLPDTPWSVFDLADFGHLETPASSLNTAILDSLFCFVKAGIAAVCLREGTYLLFTHGEAQETDLSFPRTLLQKYFQMNLEQIPFSVMDQKLQTGCWHPEEWKKALEWIPRHCEEGPNPDPADAQFSQEEKQVQWQRSIQSALIVRDLMAGGLYWDKTKKITTSSHHGLIAGIQDAAHWNSQYPHFSFLASMLNSQCDWTGLRESFLFTPEADVCHGMCMLLLHLLAHTPPIPAKLGDLMEGDLSIPLKVSPVSAIEGTGATRLSNGAPTIRPFYEMSFWDARYCFDFMEWRPVLQTSPNGGFLGHYKEGMRDGMPLTAAALSCAEDGGLFLSLAEGASCAPEQLPSPAVQADGSYSQARFLPRLTGKGSFQSLQSVCADWGAKYMVLCCGHWGKELLLLASLLHIPVKMHNLISC